MDTEGAGEADKVGKDVLQACKVKICSAEEENIHIPTITENPFKSLGKIFDVTLKVKAAIQKLTGVTFQVGLKLGSISTAYYKESSGHCCYMNSQFPPLPNGRG